MMVATPSLPPARSLAFQIRRAHLAFDRLLTARLSRHGVKSGYYHYLRALWTRDGVSQRHLSEMTSVTQTTTVALLKGMAARGLITRTRDDGDKRKSVVSLTPRGRALESRVLPDALELNRIALQGISADEIETCLAVIKRVAANLEAVYTTDPAAGG